MNLVRAVYAVVSELVNQWKEKSTDLAKIEGATYYIQGVEIARRLFVVLCILLVSFVMLIFGLLMVHAILLVILPFSVGVKLWVAAGLAVFDLSLAVWVGVVVCSQKNWLKFTRASEMLENVMSKSAVHKEEL